MHNSCVIESDQLTSSHVKAYAPRRNHSVGAYILLAFVLMVTVLALASMYISAPYVVNSPGSTYNVLGSQGDTEIIQIDTGEAGETDAADSTEDSDADATDSADEGDAAGELRMVTISESGGPGYSVSYWEVLLALFDSSKKVQKYSDVYADSATAEQVSEANQAQMDSSQLAAEVAALEYLGYAVTGTLTVSGIVAGLDTVNELETGDVLLEMAVDGETYDLSRLATLYEVLEDLPVGTTVQITVERDGETVTVPVETNENSRGNSQLGIYVSTDAEMPVDIEISLEKVGGSSAGMMFALGIIDKMTDGGIVSGVSIAGTGSLSLSGEVIAIGGIVQKMYGAVRDGSEYFLAPASNCSDVVGAQPSGLQVYAVENLDEAVAAVQAISAGTTSSLTTCEMVLAEQTEANSSD